MPGSASPIDPPDPMGIPQPGQTLRALAGSLLLHALCIALLIANPWSRPTPAAGTGNGALADGGTTVIMMDLTALPSTASAPSHSGDATSASAPSSPSDLKVTEPETRQTQTAETETSTDATVLQTTEETLDTAPQQEQAPPEESNLIPTPSVSPFAERTAPRPQSKPVPPVKRQPPAKSLPAKPTRADAKTEEKPARSPSPTRALPKSRPAPSPTATASQGTGPASSAPSSAPAGESPVAQGPQARGQGAAQGMTSALKTAPAQGSVMAAWLVAVRQKLQRALIYPNSARQMHLQGIVMVKITIRPDGRLDAIALTVSDSSGISALDQAALDTTHRATPFPKPPGGQAITLHVPVRFSLR